MNMMGKIKSEHKISGNERLGYSEFAKPLFPSLGFLFPLVVSILIDTFLFRAPGGLFLDDTAIFLILRVFLLLDTRVAGLRSFNSAVQAVFGDRLGRHVHNSSHLFGGIRFLNGTEQEECELPFGYSAPYVDTKVDKKQNEYTECKDVDGDNGGQQVVQQFLHTVSLSGR